MKRFIKLILTTLLVVLFFLLASWFYRILVLMLLARVWRERIKELRPWAFKAVMWGMVVGLFVTLPRYRYDTNDRCASFIRIRMETPNSRP